jgi:hypothetical protein
LLAITVSAMSLGGGGVSPQSASASSPRGTGRLRSATRYANRQPSLPASEVRFVDHGAVGLDRDATGEKHLQPQ